MSEQFRSKQTYPFMMVPNKIWEIGLTGNEIAVFLRVFFRANFKDECFESRGSIAEACCLSEKTVSNCFAELERLNILHITRRRIENKPNLITVNDADEWQSKRKIFPDKEQAQVNSSQGLRENLPEAQGKITYGTKLPELNSIEQDSFLNTVPTASAVEVLEAEKSVDKPHKASKEQTGGSLIFEAFADAYHDRYGFEPMRGKEANRWAKKIYEEVGAEEGQHLVRHYVSMNKQWFLQKGHSLEWCFRDLTEVKRSFVTGRTMTTTQIKQLEQRQTAKETSDEVQQSNGELAAAWARIDTTRTIKI